MNAIGLILMAATVGLSAIGCDPEHRTRISYRRVEHPVARRWVQPATVTVVRNVPRPPARRPAPRNVQVNVTVGRDRPRPVPQIKPPHRRRRSVPTRIHRGRAGRLENGRRVTVPVASAGRLTILPTPPRTILAPRIVLRPPAVRVAVNAPRPDRRRQVAPGGRRRGEHRSTPVRVGRRSRAASKAPAVNVQANAPTAGRRRQVATPNEELTGRKLAGAARRGRRHGR